MFNFLSKIIDFLVLPYSIFLILCLYAFYIKSGNRKKILLLISFCWLFLCSNSYLVNKAFLWWEYKYTNIGDLKKTYDVGIVLSGGMISVPSIHGDHPIMGIHSDRFAEAFLLYKAGKIKKILVTGTSQPHVMAVNKGETRLAAQLLVKWGVKADDVMFEEQARNTRENATYSAKILNAKFPGKEYLLITSSYHMRRSLGCFAKAKIKVDPYPADFYGVDYPANFKFILVPSSNALADFDLLWHEWGGYVMYKLVGYC